MDFNRFTEKLQEAMRAAQSKAIRYGHQQIDVEHLLAGAAGAGRRAREFHPDAGRRQRGGVEQAPERELERLPKVSGSAAGPDQIYVTPRLNKLLTEAEDEARSSRTSTSRWSTCCWPPST